MMRPTENMVLRTAAFLSVFFFTIGLAVGLLGAAYAYEMKIYFYDGGYTVSPVYEDHMINAAWKIAYDTVESGSVSDLTAGIYSPRWSNIRFSISRGDQLVYSDIDYDGIDGLKVYNFEYDGSDLYNVDSISTTKEKDAKLDGKDAVAGSVFYTVEIGLDPDMSVRDDDLFYERSIYDLADSLKALGITDVFDPAVSDFSPMTDDTAAYLSQAKHAARVAVDEEGVTAAAYTVMMMCGTAAPPEEEVDFVLNRPFVFAITGTDGLPLFVGIVHQPQP